MLGDGRGSAMVQHRLRHTGQEKQTSVCFTRNYNKHPHYQLSLNNTYTMKYIIAAIGLASLTTAWRPSTRASTAVNFTNFAVSCAGGTCSYSTDMTLVPEGLVVSCKHSTTGATIPTNTRAWSCSNPRIQLRVNKLPGPSFAYRIVVSDARIDGQPVNFAYQSPLAQWPGDASYVGPSSFTAS